MNDKTDPQRDETVADGGTDSFNVTEDRGCETEQIDNAIPGGEIALESKREFLLEAVRRAPLLWSLQSEPADSLGLSDSVDMSRSTVHRATNSLEESDIIEKTGDEYELTSLGEIIAEETKTFSTRTWTATALKKFLNSIEINGNSIPVEHFTNAKITRRKCRQPHATIHRIIELFENSDNLQMLSTVISPLYVDVGYREMMKGMEIEAIFDEESIELMLSEYPEKAHETITTGNFDVYVYDGLPFELFIFDEKVGMAAHNENNNAEILVECDNPSAINWAEKLYDKYYSKADPIMTGFD